MIIFEPRHRALFAQSQSHSPRYLNFQAHIHPEPDSLRANFLRKEHRNFDSLSCEYKKIFPKRNDFKD